MNSIKILLCDGNANFIEECRNFFDSKKIDYAICPKDGEALLRKIGEYHPDLVITEVFLPKMDAITVKENSLPAQPPWTSRCSSDPPGNEMRRRAAALRRIFVRG